MPSASTLLLGFGDIAQRVAARLPGSCTGVRRTPSAGCIAADATNKAALTEILAPGFDRILVTMTPTARSDSGYRDSYVAAADALAESLHQLDQRPRVVFVSSTSVYGQASGEWVDESSATEPEHFSGKRLLEAERRLCSADLPVVIARLSGIYGPGRDRLLTQVRDGVVRRNLLAYSNRIHADDAASGLCHLLALAEPAQCYLVSDDAPVLLTEVVRGLAKLQQVVAPEQSQGGPLSGKRVCNARLKASGWAPAYPDWRAGYQAIMADLK